MTKRLCALALWLFTQTGLAAESDYTVVRIDTTQQQLALYLNDEAGKPFRSFALLDQWLLARGQRLAFAMNAGMYHADMSPVGLLVQDGVEHVPLNLDKGKGNFFLKPNGVFLVTGSGPQVVEASQYAARSKGVRIATQSGPMLVIDGAIHPAFDPDSVSRYIRNGVGVVGKQAIFVISNHPVTLHAFATYFRDSLGCKDALYLDGSISSLYSPALGRHDVRAPLGPIIAVTGPASPAATP